jgi:hypothetical protein
MEEDEIKRVSSGGDRFEMEVNAELFQRRAFSSQNVHDRLNFRLRLPQLDAAIGPRSQQQQVQ